MKTATSVKWQKIADEFVALKRQIAPLNSRMNQLASILKEESPVDVIYGKDYQLLIQDEARSLVTKETILAELGREWFDKHAEITNFRTIRTAARV